MRAGAARREISPGQPAALYGYPHVRRVSTGVHDPLWASSIVLSSEDRVLVLVALDILMIEPAYARTLRGKIADAVQCDEAEVFVSCTHTHSGPVTSRLIAWQGDPAVPLPDPDYLSRLEKTVIGSVIDAKASLEPAELAWTSADATGVGGNRLTPDGVTDPECGVLVTRRVNDRELIGLNLIYGMHPTVLHEDSTLVSSDFPHYVRHNIHECLGNEIIICYHNAPCGNQSPRHVIKGQTFDEAERLGTMLGQSVTNAVSALNGNSWEQSPALRGMLGSVSIVPREAADIDTAESALIQSKSRYESLLRSGASVADVRTAECAVFGAEGALALSKVSSSAEVSELIGMYTEADIALLRIGDAVVIGLPGEWFTEYSLQLKRGSSSRVYVVCLVNGDLQGYIVTEAAAASDGYEASIALFGADAGAAIMNRVADLMGQIDR